MPASMLATLPIWSEPGDRDGKLTPWSTCKIDGQWFPGVGSLDDPGACIAVPKAKRELVSDKLKPVNRSNSSLIHRGYKPAQIEITAKVWTAEQWTAVQKYLPTLNPSRKITKTVTQEVRAQVAPRTVASTTQSHAVEQIPARTIEHPDLALLGITDCYITSIETPEMPEDGGVRTIKIHAVEIVRGAPKGGAKAVANISQTLSSDVDVLPEFRLDRRPP